jgi:hypothetical protein
MNTGFLNRCRVLLGAQILCLTAVAAIFLVTPLVTMAQCGAPQQQEIKNLTIVGTTPQVTKSITAGTNILNAANPGASAGIIAPKTNFTLNDITPGTWITGIYKGVLFQGTIFKVGKVNGNDKVAEVWVADPTPNTKNVKPGLVLKNVSLAGIPGA